MIGPQSPVSEKTHAEKYRGPGETFREACNRWASTLADNDDHYKKFRGICLGMRFLPAGRIQSAVGSPRAVTPFNCYVSGTIEDSFTRGTSSIISRFGEAIETMRMGGGIGYDFSNLRPRGSLIRKLQSTSAGPIPLMEIFDAGGRSISSAGHRRGAQMGVLRVDHPDIEEFINIKQNETHLTGFNISIAVTDAFMQRVRAGGNFDLTFNGQVYRTVDARTLWDKIMRSTWDWAEPGVLFIDRINADNNLHYCEKIAATNPCGEQPLPPYGACLLGSFNLVKYLEPVFDSYAADQAWNFNYDLLAEDIPHVVRAMDNVIEKAIYPLHEQEQEAISKRRMGLGVTGAANAIEALGYPYGSDSFVNELEKILEFICVNTYSASINLATEKGPFRHFNASEYLSGSSFVNRVLPQELKQSIREKGIRNSHLLSIAPTGTISLCADNVSSGIEPVFSYEIRRLINYADGLQEVTVEDYGARYLGVEGKLQSDVTAEEHIKVLCAAQRWVDSAVSKTCNIGEAVTWEAFKDLYMQAWTGGAKGCTTFRPNGKRGGILRKLEDDTAPGADDVVVSACEVDESGRRNCE